MNLDIVSTWLSYICVWFGDFTWLCGMFKKSVTCCSRKLSAISERHESVTSQVVLINYFEPLTNPKDRYIFATWYITKARLCKNGVSVVVVLLRSSDYWEILIHKLLSQAVKGLSFCSNNKSCCAMFHFLFVASRTIDWTRLCKKGVQLLQNNMMYGPTQNTVTVHQHIIRCLYSRLGFPHDATVPHPCRHYLTSSQDALLTLKMAGSAKFGLLGNLDSQVVVTSRERPFFLLQQQIIMLCNVSFYSSRVVP